MRAREVENACFQDRTDAILKDLGDRCVVLVGMPGAGKSSIGRRLGSRLRVPFLDADGEIEQAAGMSIPEIFSVHGEEAFRDGERRVIRRLLSGGPAVVATGGGAFMNAETREAIAERGVSIWLKAEFETLFARVRRRTNRPLLAGPDQRARLAKLLAEREPVFALADMTVISGDAPHEVLVRQILATLAERAAAAGEDRATATGR